MRKSIFGDITFYEHVALFERLSALPAEDIIKIYEDIYVAELSLPEAGKFQAMLRANLGRILTGSIFDEQKEEIGNRIADAYDRLITFDRTLLLSLLNKPDFFEKFFIIKNPERIQKAYEKHKGAVISLAHAGPHIILINLLSKFDGRLPVSAAGYMPNELLISGNNFLTRSEFDKARLLPFTETFFEDCLKDLKENRILLLYPEYSRSQQRAGATTSFLGKTVNMPLGASRLSFHSGKPVIPAYISKVDNYRFELEFGEELKPADDSIEAHAEIAKNVFKFIEDKVIERPEGWEGWQYFEFMSKHVGEGVVGGKV